MRTIIQDHIILKLILVLILASLLLLLLSGCATLPQDGKNVSEELIDDTTVNGKEAKGTAVKDAKVISNGAEVKTADSAAAGSDLPPGTCLARWRCISSFSKRYQYENCSFGDQRSCSYGCVNETCKPAPVCEVGFRCKDKTTFGYQTKDCSWVGESKCEGGCSENKCLPKQNTTPSAETVSASSSSSGTASQTSSEDSVEPAYTLRTNEENKIVKNGAAFHLSIYIIESDRVKLMLDGRRSDWLGEGQTFSPAGTITITVTSILYQPYGGGIQAIEYRWE